MMALVKGELLSYSERNEVFAATAACLNICLNINACCSYDGESAHGMAIDCTCDRAIDCAYDAVRRGLTQRPPERKRSPERTRSALALLH